MRRITLALAFGIGCSSEPGAEEGGGSSGSSESSSSGSESESSTGATKTLCRQQTDCILEQCGDDVDRLLYEHCQRCISDELVLSCGDACDVPSTYCEFGDPSQECMQAEYCEPYEDLYWECVVACAPSGCNDGSPTFSMLVLLNCVVAYDEARCSEAWAYCDGTA